MNERLSDNDLATIRSEILAGRKIAAIKRYRECSSCGLAAAKGFVDELERELRSSVPEQFARGPAGDGCSGIAAAILMMLFGGLCIAWGIQEGWPQWRRLGGSQRTTGTIAQVVEGTDSEADLLVVDYQANGQAQRISHKSALSPTTYSAGETVTVRYPPDRPQDGFVDSFWETWLLFTCLSSVGLLVLIGGAWLLAVRGRRAKRVSSEGGPFDSASGAC